MPKRRPASVPLTVAQLRLVALGFRIGQLLDICGTETGNQEDDIPSITSILSHLHQAARNCGWSSVPWSGFEQQCRLISADWAGRQQRIIEDGTLAPLTHLRQQVSQLHVYLQSEQAIVGVPEGVALLGMGTSLARSSGWCHLPDEEPDDEEVGWTYRDPRTVRPLLTMLNLKELVRVAANSFEQLPPGDLTAEKLLRYAQHRWGWAFIEDRIEELLEQARCCDRELSIYPAHRLAYKAHQFAEERARRTLTATEGYERLQQLDADGSFVDGEELGSYQELVGYKLPPKLKTYSSYLSRGRREADALRNQPRAGRNGRSITRRSTT